MKTRSHDIKRLSTIMAIVFAFTCLLDYLVGYLATGTVNNFIDTLAWSFIAKPLRFMDLFAMFLFFWLMGVIIILWRHWKYNQRARMNAQEFSREELRRAIQAQYQKRFWVAAAVYSAIMVLSILAYVVLRDAFIWYDYTPLYSLLLFIRDVFPYAIIVLWIGGLVVILFNQWRQNSADIVGLVDSIEQMQEGSFGDRIIVPQNLAEMGPVLQGMFDASCRDKYAAQEAETRKRDLILYLAHDLKTPLTSVIGYLSLLSENEEITSEQKKEYVKIARQKALRLEDLTNQFFEISRFNLQEVVLNQTTFNLELLLLQLGDEFFPLVEEQEKAITTTTAENMHIYGDAVLLARVFSNILKNAIAYSAPKSTIHIQAAWAHNAAVITFTNTGPTIAKEQLDMIFEKFYRLDEARGSNTGGAGLGLAIAKEIITKHGGTIVATSQDETTIFTITLPQAPAV